MLHRTQKYRTKYCPRCDQELILKGADEYGNYYWWHFCSGDIEIPIVRDPLEAERLIYGFELLAESDPADSINFYDLKRIISNDF